ncbi:MAG TPA: hypothetical protein VGL71_08310, partial [Urbifossiella sp.]
MGVFSRTRWLSKLVKSPRRTIRSHRDLETAPSIRARIGIELLEARTVPTITAMTVYPIAPTEGVAFGTPNAPVGVGTFTINSYIANGTNATQLNFFSATVHWGDGTETTGIDAPTISYLSNDGNGNAVYQVNSYHTYTDASAPGDPAIVSIDVYDLSGAGTTSSVSAPITVADAPLTTTGVIQPAVSATVGSTLTNVDVGDFKDGNPFADASDFTATISWGNPTQTSVGTIVEDASGVFHVLGSHTYDATAVPSSPISIAIKDEVSTLAISNPATVKQDSTVVPSARQVNITEGDTSVPAGTSVGLFSDLGGAQPATQYSATVRFPGSAAVTPVTITEVGA